MASSAMKSKFTGGEKVLCFHGPLLYEAKCINHRVKEKQIEYYIHYSGWNKNWDEWVPETRVLKHNEGNLQKQKDLQKAHMKTKKLKPAKVPTKKEPVDKEKMPVTTTPEKQKPKTVAPAASAATASNESSETSRKKKTRADHSAEAEEMAPKAQIKIALPCELKNLLVDDCNFVQQQKKLPRLPPRYTVEKILCDYVECKKIDPDMTVEKQVAVYEMVNGTREYFNTMVGKQLLYGFERAQHAKILAANPDKPLSEIYGSVHFVRLFVKIGAVLAYASLDNDSIELLLSFFQELMDFLRKGIQTYFSADDYDKSSREYRDEWANRSK